MELLIIYGIIITILFVIVLLDKNSLRDSKDKLKDAQLKLLETRVKTNEIKIKLLQLNDKSNELPRS